MVKRSAVKRDLINLLHFSNCDLTANSLMISANERTLTYATTAVRSVECQLAANNKTGHKGNDMIYIYILIGTPPPWASLAHL